MMSGDRGQATGSSFIRGFGGYLFGFIGVIASIIGIFAFITGIDDLPSILRANANITPTAQAALGFASGSDDTNDPTPTLLRKATELPSAPSDELRTVCSNAPKTHLSIGMTVVVAPYPPQGNNVRREPNTSSGVLFMIYPKQTAMVIDGPECGDGYVWWKIRTATKGQGWTAEGDYQYYWINPKN